MYSDDESIFYECDNCRSDIGYANHVWIIGRSEERITEINRRLALETIKEDQLVILCAHCGCGVNFEAIRKNLKSYGDTKYEGLNGRGNKSHRHGQILATCDKCGIALDVDDKQVCVTCDTGKVYCNSPEQTPDFFIENTEEIFTYCQRCSNDVPHPLLKELMILQTVKNRFNQQIALADVPASPGYPANKL